MTSGNHLLFITIDCMRADYLQEDITPEMFRFAQRGTSYTSAYANGCGTPDSFPSIFASRTAKPFTHLEGFDTDEGYALKSDDVTLAETLSSAGYQTLGFVGGNPYLGERYGYNRGFHTSKDHQPASLVDKISGSRLRGALRKMAHHMPWSPYPDAKEVTDAAVNWLSNNPDPSQPYFVWVHYMDAHFPTLPPGHRSLKEKLAAWSPIKGGAEKHQELLVELYAEAIKYIDSHISRLLPFISQDTTTVITADHGQLFGEHDSYWHNGVWEQLLRIPLVIVGPGFEIGSKGNNVQLLDLAPHLLGRMKIEPPPCWKGRKLETPNEAIYAVSNDPAGKTYTEALINPQSKTVQRPGKSWVYDRVSEPADMVLK